VRGDKKFKVRGSTGLLLMKGKFLTKRKLKGRLR
jgi:hypothetical protein